MTAVARGLQNCNPGNIRRSATVWRGMRDVQADPDFVQFIDPRWGLRAMAKILAAYQFVHGLRTVDAMLTRWAPESENDVHSYIMDVCERCHVAPSTPVNMTDVAFARDLLRAITIHECGSCPYPDALITAGLRLAGIVAESRTH